MTPYLAFDRVWKQFRRGQAHDSLRDLLPAMARRLVGRAPAEHKGPSKTFWLTFRGSALPSRCGLSTP